MGSPPQVRSGSITWRGGDLIGLRPHDIAARKIAMVPQGRRLFPSLTVIEHLTMLKGARAKTGWTLERVFGLFPRWPSGVIIAADNCPAANAACWRSVAP